MTGDPIERFSRQQRGLAPTPKRGNSTVQPITPHHPYRANPYHGPYKRPERVIRALTLATAIGLACAVLVALGVSS